MNSVKEKMFTMAIKGCGLNKTFNELMSDGSVEDWYKVNLWLRENIHSDQDNKKSFEHIGPIVRRVMSHIENGTVEEIFKKDEERESIKKSRLKDLNI